MFILGLVPVAPVLSIVVVGQLCQTQLETCCVWSLFLFLFLTAGVGYPLVVTSR